MIFFAKSLTYNCKIDDHFIINVQKSSLSYQSAADSNVQGPKILGNSFDGLVFDFIVIFFDVFLKISSFFPALCIKNRSSQLPLVARFPPSLYLMSDSLKVLRLNLNASIAFWLRKVLHWRN